MCRSNKLHPTDQETTWVMTSPDPDAIPRGIRISFAADWSNDEDERKINGDPDQPCWFALHLGGGDWQFTFGVHATGQERKKGLHEVSHTTDNPAILWGGDVKNNARVGAHCKFSPHLTPARITISPSRESKITSPLLLYSPRLRNTEGPDSHLKLKEKETYHLDVLFPDGRYVNEIFTKGGGFSGSLFKYQHRLENNTPKTYVKEYRSIKFKAGWIKLETLHSFKDEAKGIPPEYIPVTAFESKFYDKRIRKRELESEIPTTFYNANDQFPLPEILATHQPREAVNCNWVNILVAESDVFSLVDKIDGDIIICDIDRSLLNFLFRQKQWLLKEYARLLQGEITFEAIKQNYINARPPRAVERVSFLGGYHFLFNEETFKRAMERLKRKKIMIIDINLFDPAEQKNLTDSLRESKMEVKMVNLTNLPDYDKNDRLYNFLNQLPFARAPMIIWNIHDRGPLDIHDPRNVDYYAHYLFIASNAEEYKAHIEHHHPLLFAELDQMVLGEKLHKISASDFDRYQPVQLAQKRKKYLDHLQNSEAKSKQPSMHASCSRYNVQRLPRDQRSHVFYQSLKLPAAYAAKESGMDLRTEKAQEDFKAFWEKRSHYLEDIRRRRQSTNDNVMTREMGSNSSLGEHTIAAQARARKM